MIVLLLYPIAIIILGVILINKFFPSKMAIGDKVTAYYFTGDAHSGEVVTVSSNGYIIQFVTKNGVKHTAHLYQCRKK